MRRCSNWRLVARERIKQVGARLMAESPNADLKWLKAEISKAYPFGLRENYPYQVWLSELNAYIKLKQFSKTGWLSDAPVSAAKGYGVNKGKRKAVPVVEGQLSLFVELTPEEEGC